MHNYNAMHKFNAISFWVEPATINDVSQLFQLLHFKTKNELLKPLTAKEIIQQLQYFFVARSFVSGSVQANFPQASIIGCCAYFPVKQTNKKTSITNNEWQAINYYELRSVAVNRFYQSYGIGRSLVAYAERATVKKIIAKKKNSNLKKESNRAVVYIKNSKKLFKNKKEIIGNKKEILGFCFSKRSSFFEKLGYTLSSWKNFPFATSGNSRYNSQREKEGIKIYTKRLPCLF